MMAPAALAIKIRIDGSLVDITSYVVSRPMVRIMAGRQHDQMRVATTRCLLELNNAKTSAATDVGRWTNGNPNSPYYQKLTTNVELRVERGADTLYVGRIRRWGPQRWDASGRFVVMPIEVNGDLGRLTQGAKRALGSPIYRDVMSTLNDTYRESYWSMEEGTSATQFANAHAPAFPCVIEDTDVISLSSYASPGSFNLPTLATGCRLVFPVPTYTAPEDEHKVVCLWAIPAAGLADLTVMQRLVTDGAGTIAYFDLLYGVSFGGCLLLRAYDSGGVQLATTGSMVFGSGLNDTHFLTSTEVEQNGADVGRLVLGQRIDVDDPQDSTIYSGTFSAMTIGSQITDIILFPNGDGGDVSVGHLGLSNDRSGLAALGDAIVGHVGETAGVRAERLCDEEGIAFTAVGDVDLTGVMGVQESGASMIELLNRCVDVDQALLRESRTALGIEFVCGYRLNNRYPNLVLSYDDAVLGPDPASPVSDDSLLHNDITTVRAGGVDGSSARTALEDGAVSIQDPPDGAGRYDRGPVALNVRYDNQLGQIGGWLLNLRTSTDIRWQRVPVQLARTFWQSDAALLADAIALDLGDLIWITDWPAFISPEGQLMFIQGYEARHDQFLWNVDWFTTQGWPWEVDVGETSGSELAHAVSDSATTWRIVTTESLEWDTDYEPYLIQATGEAVRVDSMVTATPAFIAAGAVAHGNNAAVVPGLPAGMTPDVGQLLILVAAIRATAAFVTGVSGGWTLLSEEFSNFRIFGKYYVTGDVAPTVSFAGGAAGDDTSSRIIGFSGVSLAFDDGAYLADDLSPQTSDNSSAQNITYPSLSIRRTNTTVLLFGWKQDDWTSVATPAAMDAEAFEDSTTTGNDQGIAAYYDIQSAATDIAAGSLVVTGGASAISRAIAMALRPLQTATVVRGVNGVNVAQAAGAAVTTYRFGVEAL